MEKQTKKRTNVEHENLVPASEEPVKKPAAIEATPDTPAPETSESLPAASESLPVVSSYAATAFLPEFSEMPTESLIEATAQYLEMEPGETRDFIFTEKTVFSAVDDATGELKKSDAVMLIDRELNTFITASVVIVGALERITPPAMCRIVFEGEIKMQGGRKYKKYRVFTLPK